jgi:hypothetical protein
MHATQNIPPQTTAAGKVGNDAEEEERVKVNANVAAHKAERAKQKAKESSAAKARLAKLMGDIGPREDDAGVAAGPGIKKDGKQIRVGGAKGKEGRSDHTRGKSAFKRPCTVGWKSQNQPLQKGGGNRTPL